jgi:hypothetical protein
VQVESLGLIPAIATRKRYEFCIVYRRTCRGNTKRLDAHVPAGCLVAYVTFDRATYLVVCDVDLLDHFCDSTL